MSGDVGLALGVRSLRGVVFLERRERGSPGAVAATVDAARRLISRGIRLW
jgi:hypothetical protein